ncbi:MAG: transcriptional repressor LexA [Myxococcota bacterium]|jgi:repressor LexA|nr:transcriptional repressor LexA [Myxococcota bacterium]MEC9389164.1 transcriptional repressor LexA [Myxococcota bacterium]
MTELSQRQADVLDFIASTIESRGLPPSYREIGDALGISSTNGVSDHVKALVKKGYVKKLEGAPGVARGIQLTAKSRSMHSNENMLEIPLLGHVAAGAPILAEQNQERVINFDADLLRGSGPTFALRVRGDSMIEEGIHDGDMVLVRQQASAKNGDIVVALVDGEATVKYYFHEGDRIRLQPANSAMDPIFTGPDQTTLIQGTVAGVVRVY